jgi:hypothetical protein
MNEETKFKPTLNKPVNDQSKKFEKNSNSIMIQNGIKLNEENKGKLLKRHKLFDLDKMEVLVSSEPILKALYSKLEQRGKPYFGFHMNENIMSYIFNSQIITDSNNFQKYKNTQIPEKAKKVDKSGIKQIEKRGKEKMKKFKRDLKSKENEIEENQEGREENMPQPTNPNIEHEIPSIDDETDIIIDDLIDKFMVFGGSEFIGEFPDMKSALENAKNWKAKHSTYPKTWLVTSNGSYNQLDDDGNVINETTTAASAGGAAGYVGYAGPAAWGSGDLMKTKGKSKVMRKPIWNMGTIVNEDYLINSENFERLFKFLDEQNDIDYIQTNSDAYGDLKNMNGDNINIIKNDIKNKKMDNPNLETVKEEKNLNEKAVSKKQQKFMGMVHALQTGQIKPSEVSDSIKKAAKTMKKKDVKDFASTKHEDLPERVDENIVLPLENLYKNEINQGKTDKEAAMILLNRLTKGKYTSWDENKINEFVEKIIKAMKNTNINEGNLNGEEPTKVLFLINEKDPNDPDLFAYFPEENYDSNGILKTGYSHVGQHSAVHPDYAAKSREATPEEFADLKAELESIGYNLEVLNREGVNENEENDENLQPDENDCFIQDNTRGGYDVSCDGKFIGNYEEMDIALNIVKQWKLKSNWYPSTWFVSDHGNVSLIDDEGNIIKESSILEPIEGTMAMSPDPIDQSTMPRGMNTDSGGMSEEFDFNKINEELDNYKLHHNRLKKLNEDRKPSSLILKDRLGVDNQKNFKKDLSHSGTKEIIDIEKELQYKDQQTDIKDPQKLSQDIEKTELKATKGNALENVGDSANDKGNEIPKRNLTDEEMDEVNKYRLGMQDLVYDNETGERFEDRMKNDMGDRLYKEREEKMKFRAEAPMYNKDTQPTEKGKKVSVQYNKDKSMWNQRSGLQETFISGKYFDELGKKRIIDFELKNVTICESKENLFELDLVGVGNNLELNENLNKFINEFQFYTDGVKVFHGKKTVKLIEENKSDDFDKMKHLLSYNPKDFVNTKKIKANRGF